MPRPAPKRSRTVGKTQPKKGATDESAQQNDTGLPKSPVQPDHGSALDPRQALRNQTPLAKNHEQAIESSPVDDRLATGSRPGTGSRPPTRSRGYSSTLSFAGRKGDTGSRIPGTPSFDSSVLSNFRRRPRQQSILQMMQADDVGSSDLDDDDFLGGLSPNDESTPLRLSRGKSLLVRPSDRSSSPSGSPPSSGGSRKRQCMAQEIQVPQSPIDMVEDTPTATQIQGHGSHYLAEAEVCNQHPEQEEVGQNDGLGDGETEIDRVEATQQSQQFPEMLSQTMLPPASSPAGTATPGDPTPRPVQRSKPKVPTHLSTASLQDKLLPHRRRRRGAADHSSDDSDRQHDAASSDEDELNYPSQRPTRGRAGKSKPKPLSKAHGLKQKRVPETKPKDKAAPKESATYSRSQTTGIDKENEELLSSSPLSSPPDTDSESEPMEKTTRYVSDELRAAVKKFAEVDQWEMEFEDVTSES
ncbi:uncharacterized protein N7515_001893 [Penicillium bovifimosum]|uniref:Uncharacterized protein n=1 Tax=Penicillium bovifimosum TaxID=126998 RepID=A0A9W9HCD8_9EURO|nr:uncharacterized protein N7515_001893 [Penicillium bovifimosum]KAJ5143106.1 hypothetical protein N7515_001893 [Penicillium bovifimosum]